MQLLMTCLLQTVLVIIYPTSLDTIPSLPTLTVQRHRMWAAEVQEEVAGPYGANSNDGRCLGFHHISAQ